MKELLFPVYLSNRFKINDLEQYDYDFLESNARIDVMTYIICLEKEGLSRREIIDKVVSYNKCVSLNKLDENSRRKIIKEAIKTLKK